MSARRFYVNVKCSRGIHNWRCIWETSVETYITRTLSTFDVWDWQAVNGRAYQLIQCAKEDFAGKWHDQQVSGGPWEWRLPVEHKANGCNGGLVEGRGFSVKSYSHYIYIYIEVTRATQHTRIFHIICTIFSNIFTNQFPFHFFFLLLFHRHADGQQRLEANASRQSGHNGAMLQVRIAQIPLVQAAWPAGQRLTITLAIGARMSESIRFQWEWNQRVFFGLNCAIGIAFARTTRKMLFRHSGDVDGG